MELHVFFIKTPLELFAAQAIARTLPAADIKGLITYEESLAGQIDHGIWTFEFAHLLRPYKGSERLIKLAGWHKSLLDSCASYMQHAERIRLYIPRLKNNHSNYFVQQALDAFGKDRVRIAITPHGLADAGEGQVSLLAWLKMLAKSWSPVRRFIYGLRFFAFRGDTQGRDHPLVDRVYSLPGIHLSAPIHGEAIEVNITRRDHAEPPSGVLILGQPLLRHRLITKDEERVISDAMYDFICASGLQDAVDFLPHPRSEQEREFYREPYAMLENTGGMEALLIRRPYAMVISYCSSGLFTARMILGNESRIVSIGFNLGSYSDEIKAATRKAFAQYGIETIDCA